jgi:hypothetical protein
VIADNKEKRQAALVAADIEEKRQAAIAAREVLGGEVESLRLTIVDPENWTSE